MFKDGSSDFAAGDAVFLAALGGADRFKSPTSTHNSEDMIEREFDRHTSLIVDPPDGHIPPQTADALKRRESAAIAARREHPEDFDNALRCIAYGVPRLGGRYGAGDYGYYQIVQTPGYVLLFMETGHEARIIPLNGRPHVPGSLRFWSGDSRGRWEGQTLVIETTNFSPKSNFLGSSSGLKVVERLTRVAPDAIRYEMTMSDPTTWTQPWTAEMPLKTVERASLRMGLPRREFPHHERHARGRSIAGALIGEGKGRRADLPNRAGCGSTRFERREMTRPWPPPRRAGPGRRRAA